MIAKYEAKGEWKSLIKKQEQEKITKIWIPKLALNFNRMSLEFICRDFLDEGNILYSDNYIVTKYSFIFPAKNLSKVTSNLRR